MQQQKQFFAGHAAHLIITFISKFLSRDATTNVLLNKIYQKMHEMREYCDFPWSLSYKFVSKFSTYPETIVCWLNILPKKKRNIWK